MTTKKILAISDLSCFGKCSITVALPVISALGCEVSVLPTALLSTHTGGFFNYYYKNLTDDLLQIINHLKSQNIKFDYIYSGYLSGNGQVDIVLDIINEFKTDTTKIIVDPVMGDNGKLYANFENDYPDHILKLCKSADYLLPNVTESLLLTKSLKYDDSVIKKLKNICKSFAITSVIDGDLTGVYAYDSAQNKSEFFADKTIKGIYHGAGDLYASAVCGCLANGLNFLTAAKLSKKFVYKCIEKTKLSARDTRFGIMFEDFLPEFALQVKDAKIPL